MDILTLSPSQDKDVFNDKRFARFYLNFWVLQFLFKSMKIFCGIKGYPEEQRKTNVCVRILSVGKGTDSVALLTC